MVREAGRCELCGLEATRGAIARTIGGAEKEFCCHGCSLVYEAAYESGLLEQMKIGAREAAPRVVDLATGRGDTVHFTIEGMWCAGCAVAAERLLRAQPAVLVADVSFAAEQGRLSYLPEQADVSAILRRLERLGYRVHLTTDPSDRPASRRHDRTALELLTAAAFGMQVMLLYLTQLYPLYSSGHADQPEVRQIEYLAWILTTPILLVGGNSFLRGAWRGLRSNTVTMDSLVALGTTSAYSYSAFVTMAGAGKAYFDSVAMVTTFVMVGRYLEAIGGMEARKGVKRLLKLQPDTAVRRFEDGWQEISTRELQVGDTIRVRAGERVPADALILDGTAAINEALLTGESAPVLKEPGGMLLAGTVATDNALIARVVREAGQSKLAQMTRSIGQLLTEKPPIQRLADRGSAYLAIGVGATAVATAAAWCVAGYSASQALLVAVSVLVVACPCALGLATPLALTVAVGRCLESGILVRHLAALESAQDVKMVVFDKTGTVTLGKPTVVASAVVPQAGISPEQMLGLAAAVDQNSEHPIGKALAEAHQGELPSIERFQNLPGLGATAMVGADQPRHVTVGSARLLGVDDGHPLGPKAADLSARGETVVWVGLDGAPVGFVALLDAPNQTAREAVFRLQKLGIRTALLSGDKEAVASSVAAELAIDDYRAECTPSEKASFLRGHQEAGKRVAMVGDGINDGLALAQADLSITASGGTEAAGEVSDLVLMQPDLTLVPTFLRLARRTHATISMNLLWAFAYNGVAIPLAALGLITPAIAAAAMACSSLLVVANSLRLRR